MSDKNKMYRAIQVVASLLLVTIGTAERSALTYEWTDERGVTATCRKCPPGTYVAVHCSPQSDTVCQACPEEHYTQYWNYLDKCRFCNVLCQEGEEVAHECNATHNRVCDCQPGYHRSGHYCVRDLQCSFQEKDNDDCDKLVIDFILSLNLNSSIFRRLEQNFSNQKGRKSVSQRRIRNLLRDFKNRDPDHPLLPRLLSFLKEAKITGLEKKLRKKFLEGGEQ